MKNKVAFVTGGSRGIGKNLCLRLLKEGWNVIFTYLSNETAAEQALSEFQRIEGRWALPLKVDISREDSPEIIASFIETNKIHLDVLVFNAGVTDRTEFGSIQTEAWTRIFYANVHFPVFLLQKLAMHLNVGCSILFTGSLMAIHPHSVSLSYGVTKSTVHALIKNLVKFYADKNIRVNGVAPGFIETDWHVGKSKEIRNNIESKIALKRFGEPDEVTDVFMMLIQNTYINGEIVVCDGGYSYK